MRGDRGQHHCEMRSYGQLGQCFFHRSHIPEEVSGDAHQMVGPKRCLEMLREKQQVLPAALC